MRDFRLIPKKVFSLLKTTEKQIYPEMKAAISRFSIS